MNTFELVKQYIQFGFTHVIPLGFDHILFIISIYFLNSNVKSVIIQCSIFTIAHSISLGLTAMDYIIPSPQLIEPLISFSILFTSIENIIHNKINPYRLGIIFLFGLVHGMGFASVLKDIGLPPTHFFTSLISFNFGVEFGQIAIILLAYFLIGKWCSNKTWYKARIVYPLSSIIACIALYWTIDRVLRVQ